MQEKVIQRFEGERLKQLQQSIRARYTEQGERLDAPTDLSEYAARQIPIEDTSPLELVIALGAQGAYTGTNSLPETPYNQIESNNHLDLIIRGVLNMVPPISLSQNRCVYHPTLEKIWLGSANIVEKIEENGSSYELSADLNALLENAYQLAQQHPTAAIVFNTRLTRNVGGESSGDMGHYETFILKPVLTANLVSYVLCHRDSHMADDLNDYIDELSPPIQACAEAAGFVISEAQLEHPRYDQNGLSCGPSAVGEVIDFLLFADDDAYDGFLKKADAGDRRLYDDINSAYLDVEGFPLTREEFMRLSLHYFLANQENNQSLQHEMNMNPESFNCYLRKCGDGTTNYPVPRYLLEQYAQDAYPNLALHRDSKTANVGESSVILSTDSDIGPNPASIVPGSESIALPSDAATATNTLVPFSGVVTATSGGNTASDSRGRPLSQPLKILSKFGQPAAVKTVAKSSASRDPHSATTVSHSWYAQFFFAVITHPITRYGCLLVCLAGIVGFSIAISALVANPVALTLIHGLAISAVATVAISATVASVSGGLGLYGFLSLPRGGIKQNKQQDIDQTRDQLNEGERRLE